jgi:hypothetical protein
MFKEPLSMASVKMTPYFDEPILAALALKSMAARPNKPTSMHQEGWKELQS